MSALLAVIRKQTNGAVSDSMREKGMDWPLNYGVSIPAIKDAAGVYAPDHEFAKFLYRQEVRELRLAGIIIADPGSVMPEEIPFWIAGIINNEVAEHISFMLASVVVFPQVAALYLTPDNESVSYAVLLAASRRMIADRSVSRFDISALLASLKWLQALTSFSVWRAVATLLNNISRFSPDDTSAVRQIAVDLASGMPSSLACYFAEELSLDL